MIGGNLEVMLQINVPMTNDIGEDVDVWKDVMPLNGWLDLSGGDSKHTTYNAKIQESTHIFLCDYQPIPTTFEFNGTSYPVDAETVRMVANSQAYEVLLIDNPMGMNKQLEIYLKYTGGQ